MPPKLGQIVETILYTSDAQKLAEWYTSIFSLTPFLSIPNVVGFSLPNNTILLLFSRSSTTADKVFPSGTIPKHGCETGLGQHIAFACNGIEELREWEEHFKEKGVEILGTMDWELGGRSVYVKDWEGHVIEVMTRGVWEVY
jgi:catechol-2,3-dioxygenase